jgi:hypothetical protein
MWRTRVVFALFLGAAAPAAAQGDVAAFLGGAAVALGAHEAGHLVFDFAFDGKPSIKRVSAGPFPFFAITHLPVSPVREFTISSAGFWVQHAGNEVIIMRHPRLRSEHAPLLKGMLAFNVLTSVGYAGAAFLQRGPGERDTRGMATSARVDEPWVGAMILAPAVLDGARYYKPDVAWLKWVSRASKVGGVLLIVRAAR